MAEPQTTVGVDIGGTRIKAVAVAPDGKIAAQRIAPTVDDVESLVGVVGGLIRELAAADAAIGISAPGIAARNNRSIAWMRGRIEAVEGLDWQAQLKRNIWVLNDAHAAATAEAWVGAARGASHAVVLTLGTGVGGGVIVDGRLAARSDGASGASWSCHARQGRAARHCRHAGQSRRLHWEPQPPHEERRTVSRHGRFGASGGGRRCGGGRVLATERPRTGRRDCVAGECVRSGDCGAGRWNFRVRTAAVRFAARISGPSGMAADRRAGAGRRGRTWRAGRRDWRGAVCRFAKH